MKNSNLITRQKNFHLKISKKILNWEPQVNFTELIEEMVNSDLKYFTK